MTYVTEGTPENKRSGKRSRKTVVVFPPDGGRPRVYHPHGAWSVATALDLALHRPTRRISGFRES